GLVIGLQGLALSRAREDAQRNAGIGRAGLPGAQLLIDALAQRGLVEAADHGHRGVLGTAELLVEGAHIFHLQRLEDRNLVLKRERFARVAFGVGRAQAIGQVNGQALRVLLLGFEAGQALLFQLFKLVGRKRGVAQAVQRNIQYTVQSQALQTNDKANAMFVTMMKYPLRNDSPDYAALYMANYILGGGFLNSRLATRIRQKEGVSYGVGSFMSADDNDEYLTKPEGRTFAYDAELERRIAALTPEQRQAEGDRAVRIVARCKKPALTCVGSGLFVSDVAGGGARREYFDDEVGRPEAAPPLNLGGVANDADIGLHHGVDGLVGSGFAGRNGSFAFVVFDQRGHVGRGGHGGAVGLVVGPELAHGAVARLEVGGGHALHVGGRHLAQVVAVEIDKAPVAGNHVLAQRQPQLVAFLEQQLDILQQLGLSALYLFSRNGLLANAVERTSHHRAGRVERTPLPHIGVEIREARHGIVGLVKLLVKGLEVINRHALNVFLRADGTFAVVVPQVSGVQHAVHEHAAGRVFAALKLVAHHAELAVQVLLGNEGVDHAVGFQVERPLQILVGSGESFEVVGAVVPGRAIGAGAVLGQLLRHVGVLGRALKHHVLQQVGHAAFAVAFVPRAHQVGDIDGSRGLRLVGKQQHPQPVGQPVFGDALHGGHLRDARRQRG
nr:hypothetical protein [Tanacetum cinerariifolium]